MILIIDDDIAVQTSLALLLSQHGFQCLSANGRAEALQVIEQQELELIILDLNFSISTTGEEGMSLLKEIRKIIPQVPVILITGWATIDLAIEGMRAGAKDFISKPWENAHILQSVRTILDLKSLPENSINRRKLDEEYELDYIIGEDPAFLSILENLMRIAPTDASVLILGESGTGKELIAEAIHQNSKRKKQAFIKVNLGGIPANLFESELFGHKRGAFTDARFDRKGRFELADKGSIFLDEIGDIDKANQVKLLRVLQDRTFEVLGSSYTKTADVRIISATNRDLTEMVQKGTFREDLFYRINLITIKLPPLRERPSDIPLLVQFFINNLRKLYHRPDLKATRAAMNWLKQLHLPGNIRQLKNLVERTVLVSPHDELDIEDFQGQLTSTSKTSSGHLPEVGSMTLEEMEIEMIKKAMIFHKGKVTAVARTLGLTRSAMYRRLEKYNIPYS